MRGCGAGKRFRAVPQVQAPDNAMAGALVWLPDSKNVLLTKQEIHVWRTRLNVDGRAFGKLQMTLSIDERRRAAQFVFERDRRRFIAARGLLRDLLSAYVGLAANKLKFTYGPLGKPSLVTNPTLPDIHFNLAHSREHAVFAFSVQRHVGIDLEFVQENMGWEAIAERYFSSYELAALRALPEAARLNGFYRIWTRKEAYLKALGSGLHESLAAVEMGSTLASDECVLGHIQDDWNLVSFSIGGSYPAALVYSGTICRVRYFSKHFRQ